MTLELKLNELNVKLKKELTHIFHEEAAKLFKDNPDLHSFGWHQYLNQFSIKNYIGLFMCSIQTPNISGALGELICAHSLTSKAQLIVKNFLQKFDKNFLQ